MSKILCKIIFSEWRFSIPIASSVFCRPPELARFAEHISNQVDHAFHLLQNLKIVRTKIISVYGSHLKQVYIKKYLGQIEDLGR